MQDVVVALMLTSSSTFDNFMFDVGIYSSIVCASRRMTPSTVVAGCSSHYTVHKHGQVRCIQWGKYRNNPDPFN